LPRRRTADAGLRGSLSLAPRQNSGREPRFQSSETAGLERSENSRQAQGPLLLGRPGVPRVSGCCFGWPPARSRSADRRSLAASAAGGVHGRG
jgi:hypothetical protein